MRKIPLLDVKKRVQEITKSFPREVEYGDALMPGDYNSNCVFVVNVIADEGLITLEELNSGECIDLTADEATTLGMILVRAGKAVERL